MPNHSTLNITGPITIEAWIKSNAIDSTNHDIVSRINRNDSSSGGGYSLTVNTAGKLRLDLFQNYNSYTTLIGTTVMSTGVWHHVAGVFNGSQMRVYVDGVLDGSLNTTDAPGSGSSLLRIGKAAHPANTAPLFLPSFAFAGLIDEVRVSAAALYTSNFTPGLGAGSNVRGLWKFDGQTANDFSGTGNHGALQNGAIYSTDVPSTGGSSQPPVPVANGPYSGQLAQAVQFSSTGSVDPDGTIATYNWNFGDGTSANTANPSHIYAAPGIYTATLTLTDNTGLLASATAPVTIGNGGNARLDPANQTGGTGENPLSRNFNWTLPLVSLRGRAGMDFTLSLSYNSLVWTKPGTGYISFDDDRGFPSPGFRLGFPVIQPLYYNAEVGKYAFLMIGSDGTRTELRRVGASTLYEAADSTYLLLDSSTMILRATDGTQFKYELKGADFQCTEIKDRNGNYITINYLPSGRINTIIDTLGRNIKFNYDANSLLTSITQIWNQTAQNPPTHIWASFAYSDITIQTSFGNLTVSGPTNGSTRKTLSKVTLADGAHYDFSYTSWGQVWKLSSFAADNHLLNYRVYNLPQTADPQAPYADCPRFTERRDWAENWNQNASGVEQEAITTYTEPVPASWTMPDGTSKSGTRAEVTTPDGTVNKIYFVGTTMSSGWQRGLPALVETYSGSNWQRKVMTTWTQDDTNVSYPLNPRVTETNVDDPAGNRARVQITYQQATFSNGTSCSLPRDVYEYAADGDTILRSTRTDYHTNTVYTNRRILGLVTERRIYDGNVNNGGVLKSKIGFFYDNENGASSIQGADAPVQHDNTNYAASFVTGRANLSSVRRYDVANTAQFTTTSSKYNTAGAVVSNTDASGHVAQISYADSFSDGVSRSSFAYPTKLTDADGYYSTLKYNYDFGALTYRQTPPANFNGSPASQPSGPEQTFSYDAIGRLQQVTNEVNNAYTRYAYPTSQIRVDTYATVQDGLGEAHSFKFTDGADRIIGTATEHPGSNGGYSGQKIIYDVLGRVIKTSNPTETSAVGEPSEWAATGDDAAWSYSQQTYDWKGRLLVTTNPNGMTLTASYSGCGCAGGEVVTLTDAGTLDGGVAKRRQQKIYSDVLGRQVKTEVLNWSGGSVYSTIVNTYNARDQIELITQYAGAEGSATHQETTVNYDGYGRLKSRHVPEQDDNKATVWTYNADDTVNTITDARGAVSTFGYAGTNRHLVKQVTHALTGKPTLNSVFTHDAAGNRLSMTDGAGSVNYVYNQLSQLTSETRNLTGVGNFTLAYAYNMNGQLSSITDPFGAQVGYSHDKVGRLSAITGSNFASVSSYASNLQYRAWGALKSLAYGNSKTLALGYDANLNVSTYEIPGLMKKSYQYYDDGRLKFTQDQFITNSKYDRLYKFDHIGRVTSALSGAEARGQGTTDDRPYNETMAYDAMGHLTLRDIRHWNRWDSTGNQTFTNNRRQGWQYDADGRLLSGESIYTYDAAGRISTFGAGDPYETDQQLDGDGRRIKSVQRKYDLDTNQWVTEKVTYYIHSSRTGQVVSEISAQGAKERSFVYAAGSVIAIQGATGGSNVSWQYYDATRASYRAANAQGAPLESTELDPVGASVGLFKPLTWAPPESPGKLEPYYGVSELNSATKGCIMDHIPAECETALGLAKRGAATIIFVDPVSASRGRRKAIWVGSDTSYGTSDLDNNTVTVFSGAGGQYVWVDEPGEPVETFIEKRRETSPKTISSYGNSKNCKLEVSFAAGTFYQGNLAFPNGASAIVVTAADGTKHILYGLGFTVTGSVTSGGIGRIGQDSNPQNPSGAWTIDQWTSSWNQQNGSFVVIDGRVQAGGPAWRDISPSIPFKAVDNTFSWYDHPSGEGWGTTRFQNFTVKVFRGDEYCQADFHFTQIDKGPGYELIWGEGLLR